MLEEREQQLKGSRIKRKTYERLTMQFVRHLTRKGISENSARAKSVAIRSFFAFYEMPLVLRKGMLPSTYVTSKDHVFTLDELRRMFELGDTRDKAWLTICKDLMLRVTDIVGLEREILKTRKFQLKTQKQGIIAHCHISDEAMYCLENYWETIPESKWAFPSIGSHISDQALNDALRRLWNMAFRDEEPRGKLRLHCLRKFGISTLANLGINTWIIKRMVGKKIAPDMAAYLTDLNIDEAFLKYEMVTRLNAQVDGTLKMVAALLTHPEKLEELQTNIKEWLKHVEE